jgi:predicted dehydrogenase
MPDNVKVLIVGAGIIAEEYIKVLLAQDKTPVVITRGEEKARKIKRIYPEIEVKSGGLENVIIDFDLPRYAIIATPVENLASCTKLLIKAGCENILVEKPLTYFEQEADEIKQLSKLQRANVFIAFNRRSYQSVIKAKELIHSDGGVFSFHFDFTEAIFRIDPINYDSLTTKYWGIANSSHIIDTAFYLGGKPTWIECKQYGNKVGWHPAGSIFTGMGETEDSIPFTYHANWGAPGRWNIEIMTANRKLMFSPMERLKQQYKNSFVIEEVDTDYHLDNDFKPGFYRQVSSFLNNEELFSINDLGNEISILNKIFNY